MAGVQPARDRARRGRQRSAARAAEVHRDRGQQPRRVLHGPRGGPPRSGRRRHRDAAAGRADAARDAQRDPQQGRRAQGAPVALPADRAATRAQRARHPHRLPRRRRRRGARAARRALPAPDLPRPDPARGRARAPVPVHLQPVAVARRRRPRPGQPHAGVRAREGADGDAAALRAARRRQDVRAARGADRPAPRPALPGHGDRRHRGLPRHPRRRLHRLRRGRRPPAGGRGRAAAAALRRGRARRGRVEHEPRDARAARARARGRPRRRVRRRRAARPQRPLGDREDLRLLGAARPAVDAGDAAAAAAPGVRGA